MKKSRAVIATVLGVAVLAAVVSACAPEDSASADSAEPAAKKTDKPEGKAKFKLLPKRAQCWNDITGPGVEIQVNYHVRIKNVGTAPGTVEVIPARHYSDGSSNDSWADAMTATIAPGEIQSVMGSWDTDQDHLLVACEAYVSGTDDDSYDTYSIPVDG